MRAPFRYLSLGVVLCASLVHADPAPIALAPFRLPAVDNKPIPVTANQHTFRLPIRFARVESFYRGLYATDAEIRFVPGHDDAGRTLTIQSRKPGDAWTRAVIHEGVVDTLVEVVPVFRIQAEIVQGNAKPWVTFVFKHSDEVRNQANSIDHLGRTQ